MRLNIAQKIFGIAFTVLLLMLIVAVYSIRLTAEVSGELDRIANQHLPMTETISRVNANVLEKGLILQRLFVLARGRDLDEAVAQDKAELEVLRRSIDGEFKTANELLRLDKAVSPALGRNILAFEAKYRSFEKHGRQLVEAREATDIEAFERLLPELEKRQDEFDSEILSLRSHLVSLTNAAVLRAERNEDRLLLMNITLTALATIIGFGFALFVSRLIVTATRNLAAGAKAVEAGDLDTTVPVTTGDEVGQLTASFNHMVSELRLKERIKETFGKYMDPRIVSNLLENPEFTEPGGERREMTVLFIDLKGFTSISEVLAPADLVRMINSFFGHMTTAISENKGVVDKFMGDAVMAYWGPPFTGSDEHAEFACKAALEAVRRLEDFRNDVATEIGTVADGLDIDLRVGISSGEMVVGTIGSKVSMSFTVMGDPVNLGSRLEGASKAYGTHIIISDRTRELAGGSVTTRELDQIRVKGKLKPTRIYELLGPADGSGQAVLPAPFVQQFHAGIEAYRLMQWDAAERAFLACLEVAPDDPPSRVYMSRIAQLRAEPPALDWDGVWTFETK